MRPRFPHRGLCALLLALTMAVGGRAAEAAVSLAERGLPVVRNFPPRAYSGPDQVWPGVVASDGTVYFGNASQVIAFDGLEWTQIPVPGAAFVRVLVIGRDGVLYAAGVNELGRIVRGPDGMPHYESLRALVPSSVGNLREIWTAYATDDGVWFQSSQAVLRWRDGKFDVWMIKDRFIDLAFWLGDYLLVAKGDGWFKPGPNGTWIKLGDPSAHLERYLPHFAVPHPQGGWLMGIEGPHGDVVGLARWDGSQLKFESHPLDAYFKTARLFSAVRLRDGRYVFTTLRSGAVVLDQNLQYQQWLTDSTGLPSNVVIGAVEDAHGAVWLATEFGIARVGLNPAYAWFNDLNGLNRGNDHTPIRWQGQLLVASTSGIMRLRPDVPMPGVPKFEVWSEVDDKVSTFLAMDDGLMVGGLGGVWFVTQNHATKVKSFTNTKSLRVSRRDPGRLYAVSLNGLAVFRRQGAAWEWKQTVTEAAGFALAEDADGAVWVGTENAGAVRLQFADDSDTAAPKIERFDANSGLGEVHARVAFGSIEGELIFMTNRCLYRFDRAQKRFRPDPRFGTQYCDGSARVEVMEEDRQGRIWMLASPPSEVPNPNSVRQLGYLRKGRWHQLPLPDLERIDGMAGLYPEFVDGRQLLWLTGQSVVLRIDVNEWEALHDAPIGRTILHEVETVDGRVIDPAQSPCRIPARSNSLRFRFGTPGLAGEPDVRHETRLIGFHGDGAELTTAGQRTFTNLPPGHYVFEVRGRSADGRWSEPARRAFDVLAPWWETPWAWLGYIGLAGLGTYGIVRRRTRGLEIERTRLENVVAARTAELAEKNRELERLARFEQDEKLAARLAEEKAQLELLRYQLNPHFLFNSLNSIRALVYANANAAGEMVTRLSEFCRSTLVRGSDEFTTVADEAEMLQTYLQIEKVRWQDGLVTSVTIAEEARHERLPQFLLLPLIENAIKYGGRTSPGTLEVNVAIRVEGEWLVCDVANTGTWIDPKPHVTETSTRIGLDNLRRRLARHYGVRGALHVRHENGWVTVTLRLRRDGAMATSNSNPAV